MSDWTLMLADDTEIPVRCVQPKIDSTGALVLLDDNQYVVMLVASGFWQSIEPAGED